MRYRTLGKTDIEVSEICLGTMTWGTQNTLEEGHAQIERALEDGVNFMDTAEMYPVNPVRKETAGDTEAIIGEYFARSGKRKDWVLATKIALSRRIFFIIVPLSKNGCYSLKKCLKQNFMRNINLGSFMSSNELLH